MKFNKNIKPTKSNVMKSLFNILYKDVINKKCLDLFSGSGSLGIKSLQLKASKVIFNDICYKNILKIKKNVNKLNFNNAFFYNSNAFTLIKKIGKLDIIYIDPPYKLCNSAKFIDFIKICLLKLNDNGKIYLEYSKKINFPYKKFKVYKKKRFGNTVFIIISKY
ncbi:RsmD family RNA methyltransferase [Candidatus Vidania fulgoroideorum]